MHRKTSLPYKGACLALIAVLAAFFAHTQPINLSFEIKKPKNYQTRVLPSEKSGYTKFSWPKRFYNNTVSRFNYYFNANNILSSVITASKEMHKDDYSQLLPFYNYELSESYKARTDSVVYKATAGILLHDLRSDWVDKLYLLMGKAYLLRKDFDSATSVFQYINYAFAPKDGSYDLPIGSNASNTGGVFTIATREKRSLWKRIMNFPSSRNESFLWQIRTYIEQGALVDASGLLEIIRVDPNFPSRLKTDLEEITAYLSYKQQNYSDAADHLLQALPNAESRVETARWEYLAAQMYALAGNSSKAIATYEQSIQHTSDPLMEVHARLNVVSLASGTEENALQKNLDELLKMAKRDKYETQRDVIYYAAAQLELKRKNYAAAQALLLNSIKFNVDNATQKQLSFLLLGDLNYERKSYLSAYNFYDSVQADGLKEIDQARVAQRKPALQIISHNQLVIVKEDSLQKLASLMANDRIESVRKTLRQLRRERGLKDLLSDPLHEGAASIPTNIFAKPSAEFYFLNSQLKKTGLNEFKLRWGTRPNIDNWRRRIAVDRALVSATPSTDDNASNGKPQEEELSMESLLKNIPLTAGQIDTSNQAIIKSLMDNAFTFQNKLEDYPSAIEMYEELLRRYSDATETEEALYNLSFLYNKNGEPQKADAAINRLKKSFPKGKMVSQLHTATTENKNTPASQAYESVYRLFLEGQWGQAKEAKLAADKAFGKNYWTPQLLYIESIYYIKQQEDSIAIHRLQNIQSMFAQSPLAAKAGTMIDVLKRRKEIENYLTNLDISKPEDIRTRYVDLNASTPQTIPSKHPDSIAAAPTVVKAIGKELVNLSNPNMVDIPSATSKKDSIKAITTIQEIAPKEIVVADNKPKTISANGFDFNPADTSFVVVIMDKVDPVFVSEARNAFNRFNQERYVDAKIGTYNRKLNDRYYFLFLGPFNSAAAAISYIDKTKPITALRILPWLAADKYSFSIITNSNMSVLSTGKQDIEAYRNFLHGIFPDKF